MKVIHSITLFSVLVSLITGCETSNQNYSNNNRVIDARAQAHNRPSNASNNQTTANRPVQIHGNGSADSAHSYNSPPQNSSVVEEVIVDETVPNYAYQNQGSNQGNYGNQDNYGNPSYNQSSPVANNPANSADTIIYNGNGQPYNPNQGQVPPGYQQPNQPPYYGSQGQTANYPVEPISPLPDQLPPTDTASSSSSSGNWLLLDSDGAKQDVSNTEVAQQVIEKHQQQQPSATSVTVYENSIATTAGPDKYRVVQGDTLYSIAFRYGLDYHSLANKNNIQPPYNLAVGQILTLNLKASQAPVYIVKEGDTLYSIASKHGQSVAFLAGVNNLTPPYNLSAGQRLKLSRDNAINSSNANLIAAKENMEVPVAGKPNQIASTTPQAPKPSTPTSSAQANSSPAKPATPPTASTAPNAPKVPATAQTPIINSKTRTVSGVTWSWPTTGKVIEQFSTAEQGNKGVDIAGQRGQAILSAADGQVVYSGNALRGFGNLIIINHTNEFLSAYAHNDVLLVKEGQKVKRGQQIARMGSTDTSSVRLHFEIRYRGQSVNPVSYLPK